MKSTDKPTRRQFVAQAAALLALPGVVPSATAAEAGAPARAGSPAADVPGAKAVETYATIDQLSWNEIVADRGPQWTPPLTVHLPIQPAQSRDFLHVDCALNVCRRRILPRVLPSNVAGVGVDQRETFVIEFALDDPPLVPDLRTTRLTLAEGKYPLARGSCRVGDYAYEVDYFCHAVDDEQSICWASMSVTNVGQRRGTAHVRTRVDFRGESELFKPHYVPYAWDRRKWLPGATSSLAGTAILRNSKAIGRIEAGAWKAEWEEAATFPDALFDAKYGRRTEGFAAPQLRLEKADGCIHFSADLEPGEKKTFALAVLANYEGATAVHQEALLRAEPGAGRAAALRHFQSQIGPDHARLTFPQDNWDKVFTALQLSTLQLLVRCPGVKGLVPTQGGSNERHFVWVWEAAFMLLPMLRLGHFQAVRQGLDFIFSLQDAGYPPSGQVTTAAGSVGTTGPRRWLCMTGSALALAADYQRYARDPSFLPEFLPKIVKAAQWIVGEVRATRKLNADGSRPPWYGLMPFGCATDGDVGYFVAFTDAYTFGGLEKTVRLLERLDHPKAAEFRKELEAYRDDLDRAIQAVTRPDGYIERKIAGVPQTKVYDGFEAVCGAIHLAFVGALDIHAERFRRHLAYVETHLMEGYFTGRVSPDIYYMGIGEFTWQQTYLRLGQWKKAFAAMRVNLRYGMTQDAFQVQERFSRLDPTFTPWQPNGSGNGRILEMMLNALYFEHDGLVTLLGGVPWAWLRANQVTRVDGLYTPQGRLSLDVTMVDARHCRLVLSAAAPGVLPARLCLPEHFELRQSDPAPARRMKQVVEIAGQPRRITLDLHEAGV
jgi:hypothetical protein